MGEVGLTLPLDWLLYDVGFVRESINVWLSSCFNSLDSTIL